MPLLCPCLWHQPLKPSPLKPSFKPRVLRRRGCETNCLHLYSASAGPLGPLEQDPSGGGWGSRSGTFRAWAPVRVLLLCSGGARLLTGLGVLVRVVW